MKKRHRLRVDDGLQGDRKKLIRALNAVTSAVARAWVAAERMTEKGPLPGNIEWDVFANGLNADMGHLARVQHLLLFMIGSQTAAVRRDSARILREAIARKSRG